MLLKLFIVSVFLNFTSNCTLLRWTLPTLQIAKTFILVRNSILNNDIVYHYTICFVNHYFRNQELFLIGRGPEAVAKAAWLELGDRGFVPRSGIQVSKRQNFSSCSLVNIQYCGESP